MKEKACCFTGHRDIAPDQYEALKEKLEIEILFLIRQGYVNFIAGGALGFDTLAAISVLKLRDEYNDIKLTLALPCPEQPDKWNETDKALYNEIKRRADEVIYVSGYYHQGCMQKRNRYMVDNSSCCVAYMNKMSGGTKATVQYCYAQGVTVVNIT